MAFWDDLAAGGYSALNAALFGAPEWLVKTVGGSDTAKALEAWKKDKEEAMRIGDIVGTVGSLLIPGGAIAKGVGKGVGLLGKGAEALGLAKTAGAIGKGAEALGTVGDIIKGTRTLGATGGGAVRLGGSALRGALGAAETALPRALFGGTEGLPESLAAGAVLGPLGGAIGKRLGKLGSKAKGMAGNAALKSLGVTEGMLKSVAGKGLPASMRMTKAGRAEDIKSLFADLAGREKFRSMDDVIRFAESPKTEWVKVAQGFNSLPAASRMAELAAIPGLAKVAEEFGDDGAKAVAKLIKDVGRRGDYNTAKAFLRDKAAAALRGGVDDATMATGAAAREMLDSIDDIAARATPDVDLAKLKREYPARVLAEEAALKKASSLETPFAAGSPTAEKQIISRLLGGGAGAATIGGFDPNDPSTWAKAGLAGIGGSLGGAFLAKSLPRLANRIAGGAGRIGEAVGGKLGKVLDPLAVMAPKAIGIVGTGGEADKLLEGGAAPAGGVGMGAASGTEAGAARTEAAIDAAAPTPEAAEAAKTEAAGAVNQKFRETIIERLFTDWQLDGWAASGIPFEQFSAEVERVTGGFDPKKAAKVLFKDKAERAAYLKEYDTLLQYKAIDIGQALAYEGAANPLAAGFQDLRAGIGVGDPEYLNRKKAFEDVKNLLENLATKEGQAPRATLLKEVMEDVSNIAKLKATPAEKQSAIEEMLASYGLDVARMREWGLM